MQPPYRLRTLRQRRSGLYALCHLSLIHISGGEYPDVDHVVAKLRVEGTFLDVGEVVTLHRALSLSLIHISDMLGENAGRVDSIIGDVDLSLIHI